MTRNICNSIAFSTVMLFGATALFATGCAAQAGGPETETQPASEDGGAVGSTQEALSSGGGGGGGNGYYSCSALGCICYGDFDCNNMFSDGVCGSMPAKCYERGPTQYCICAPWVRTAAKTAVTNTVKNVGTLSSP